MHHTLYITRLAHGAYEHVTKIPKNLTILKISKMVESDLFVSNVQKKIVKINRVSKINKHITTNMNQREYKTTNLKKER